MLSKLEKIEVSLEQAQAAETLDPSTVEQVHNPVELETKMVEEEKKRLDDIDPAMVASNIITFLMPKFKHSVTKLSNRQLKRMTVALIEYPLKEYDHLTDQERNCFYMGCALLDAKFSLIQHTYNENAEKIRTEAEALANSAETTVQFGSPENNEKEKEVIDNGKV